MERDEREEHVWEEGQGRGVEESVWRGGRDEGGGAVCVAFTKSSEKERMSR